MATIYDIAKKAGVSPTTVSKVFNNYTDVSEKTKIKVLKIADEMGYIPNLSARSLKTNKSHLVGVLFSEGVGIGLEHQFFSVVLESFRKRIGAQGYDTIFINNSIGNQNIGYLEHCKYRNIDGLFIITALENDMNYPELLASDLKVVTTDIQLDHTPSVMSDNRDGSRLAVEYLYNHGHRKIGHLSGPLDTISAQERYEGYKIVMNNIGLGFDENLVIVANMYKYQDAYEATLELYNRFGDDYPSALFVGADIMAVAAIQALESIGLNVPNDVSIVGFDDVTIAQYSHPPLTTIRQDKKLIGCRVADTLYKLINREMDIDYSRVPVSLVERGSVTFK